LSQHTISLSHPNKTIRLNVPLTASKSECNRALIIRALTKENLELQNISAARDCQTMIRLLASEDQELNVLDAGTTMRFLTAYCSVINRESILTGTTRMQERPIKILVDALKYIGADITYSKKEGYPPIHIKSFEQKKAEVSIAGNVSSQYISAILMIAPLLPLGIKLKLTGEIASRPYISMTLKLMHHFGITYNWKEDIIEIANQDYKANSYTIESDWSGASYWYSIAALSDKAEIKLLGLRKDSFQGDLAIVEIMNQLGIESQFDNEGVTLAKKTAVDNFNYDFTQCPDLAQTIAIICAAKGIKARLSGLESLRIKESDRIDSLRLELKKVGVQVIVEGDQAIGINGKAKVDKPKFHSYEDHRVAMALAPLALLGEISIDDPDVVNKSYPSFWEHLKQAGFDIS